MISKRDLLIEMGELQPTEDVLDKVEKCIIEAAQRGKTDITYYFTSKMDIDTRRTVVDTLVKCGYNVHYGGDHGNISYSYNGKDGLPIYCDETKWVTIGWGE